MFMILRNTKMEINYGTLLLGSRFLKKTLRHKSEKNSKIDDELRRSLSHSVANEMALKAATRFRCSTVKAEQKS